MNSPRESLAAAAVQILSRMMERPRASKPRRFRPLAEPMEARAVLSQVAFTQTIVAPVAMANVDPHRIPDKPAPSGFAVIDSVEVNGQVEIQPGD